MVFGFKCNYEEKETQTTRNIPGTRLINWYKYAKQFTKLQWENMTEQQKMMRKITSWIINQDNWIYLNFQKV